MENKCEFTFKDLNGNAGKIVKYENINHTTYTKDDKYIC